MPITTTMKRLHYLMLPIACLLNAQVIWGDSITEITIPAPMPETSDLLTVQNRRILQENGWDRAFWTIGDENDIRNNLTIIGHTTGAPIQDNWIVKSVEVRSAAATKTDDAEILCRKGDWIYILGSHFGKKKGPLSASRQFVARFNENNLAQQGKQYLTNMEICNDNYLLFRLLNDALNSIRDQIIISTDRDKAFFILQTIKEALKQNKALHNRIRETDWPINLEGADFTETGTLLIGFRYPVSREGHPVLIEIENMDNLFQVPITAPNVKKIYILNTIGSKENLTGIRSLHRDHGKWHVITGGIDGRPEVSLLLQEHVQQRRIGNEHHTFIDHEDRSMYISATIQRTFSDKENVEGLAFDTAGNPCYIRDANEGIPLMLCTP